MISATPAAISPARTAWTIFLVSVVGLLLEMMLIRWIGTEIRIFAYLQNTVLIVCFLGLGVGCFTCRQPVRLARGMAALAAVIALVAVPLLSPVGERLTENLSAIGGMVIWGQSSIAWSWKSVFGAGWALAATFFIMLLLWEIFLPMGRLLGRSMGDHPSTIWAYSVNVAGSLLGIWLFVGLSSLTTGPLVWVAVAAVILVALAWQQADRNWSLAAVAAMVLLAACAGRQPGVIEVAWSPYQKLTFLPAQSDDWKGTNFILVNNVGYQALIDNREAAQRANPRVSPEQVGLTQYDVPTAFYANPGRVLVVGAGSGNDVAGALRGGAKEVTAVEIDPAIIEFGRRFHPERPYDSANVEVVIDDARSYFATTCKKFDLIIFGLLDSHTTTSMSNARLDHYVYTRESLERARTLLADGGVMVLSFDATRMFIADRMSRCLHEVFGAVPLAFRIPPGPTGWGGTLFVAGDQQAILGALAANPRLSEQISRWQAADPLDLTHTTRVATDDWPYIYLPQPSIPTLYLVLGGLLAALVAYGCSQAETRVMLTGWNRTHWHFFLMGAAFLLLEVQNISKASVVLGNTWLVSAVIVSGIMCMILLSNLIAASFPRLPQGLAAAGLLGSCIALYFVDLAAFASLPFWTKSIVVGLVTTLPMLFSGLIFIDSFAKVERKDIALGANLLGALTGGILQSITFLTGISALLLIVAGLYALALLAKPRQSSASAGIGTESTTPTADSWLWRKMQPRA
ncbi:MAG: hypothetical protein SFU86_10630 [Pirellulaceae bacterium]|nr:hypothetical protein [Pirellulaceae bacterium]